MKNQKMKRILAFLLCFELLLSMACNAIPVVYATETDGTTEVTCDCPMTDGLHNGTCPYYTCPNCGLVGWAHFPEDCPALEESGEEESTACTVCGNEVCTCETVEEETKEETEEEDPGEEETTVCEVCGNEPCTCETAEEETTPDYSGDIDKNATFNPNGYESVIVMDTEPNEDWETASMEFYVSEFSGDILFGIDAYKVVATDYHTYDDNGNIIDTETVQSLWYQVSVLGGTTPADFANGYWIFQNYLGDNAEEYDVLILSAPEENVCEICGETDCTAEHVWCDTCGKYDCGLTHEVCEICGKENCSTQHTYCGVCGGLDCTTEHVYCSICKDFDCGIEHETEPEEEIDNKPITAPVIPENPTLPDKYDVAVLTGDGVTVTESGLVLPAGYKASLSAWSALGEDVSYQWQICCDAENDLWADITGQTGKGLLFSHAMFAGVQDDASRAYVRCVTSAGNEELTSEPVCITIDYTDYEAASASAEVATAAFSLRTDSASLVAYADGDDNYVTVTINYWDENSFGKDVKNSVYEPYRASILKGSPFNTPVTSPTYLGYAAYYDRDGDGVLEEEATDFNPGLLAVNEDVTFDLYYQPIEVPVAIRYFFQNINDDDYTENTSYYYPTMLKTGTIVSDAYLEACLAEKATALGKLDTLAGFSKMHHEPEAVAADGSTVFECYYDRNYFLLSFRLGEGAFGAEPIYARYETPILVSTPVKPGHSFNGWNLLAVDVNDDGRFDNSEYISEDPLVKDPLPSTLPAENRKYEALWTEADTSYTAVYWLMESGDDNDHSKDSYLCNTVWAADTGATISGSDNLGDVIFCGMKEHTHTASCSNTCGLDEHGHTTACISNYIGISGELTGGDDLNAILAANGGVADTEGIYLYFIQSSTDEYYSRYWPKLYVGGKYYTITVNGSNPIRQTQLDAIVSGEEISHGTATLTAYKYAINPTYVSCGETEHIHSDACNSCGQQEHTHDGSCPRYDASRLVYVKSDANVTVKGDGSTILNVYYKYKDYTLRFYYARSSGTTYQVVGGSTYGFGTNNDSTYSIQNQLENVTDWGTVQSLPTVAAEKQSRYNYGSETYGSYKYYYLEFTAPYQSNLKNLWPVDIFDPTPISGTHSEHSSFCTGNAYFSAWNGEYRVKYTQDHDGIGGDADSNQTIKGLYLYLDDNLLYDTSQFEDSNTVSFLAFWEDGANIGWSIPKTYRYYLWLKPTSDAPATTYGSNTSADYYDAGYSQYNHYTLYESFNVYDDSGSATQTATSIRGYELAARSNIPIDATTSDGDMEEHIINFFYTCGGYTLELHNISISETIGGKDSIEYGTPLDELLTAHGYDAAENYAPDYPVGILEEGGYDFEGWYPSEDFIPSTRVDLSTATMPYNDLILYANWQPKTHTVRFFHNLTVMEEYLASTSTDDPFRTVPVTHGNTVAGTVIDGETVDISAPPKEDHPSTNNSYTHFVRWFYLENGKRIAFSMEETPIKGPLDVYGGWRDERIQPYRVSYAKLDGTPNDTSDDVKIADDTFGYAYLNETRTFNAKSGDPDNQLYDGYSTGYYPLVASHSILMEMEDDEHMDDPEHNLYTFYYTTASEVTYKVRYVNSVTGAYLEPESDPIDADGKNVVTERYKAFEGYTPDAFYKRLVLSVKDDGTGNYVGDDDANIITFYYTPNTTQARYVIHYMTETLDDNVYERDHMVEGIGTVDQTVPITPTSIAGFEFDPSRTKFLVGGTEQGSLSYTDGTYDMPVYKNGSELYLYYKRLDYDYVVHYYKYNTTTPIDSVNHPSLYGFAPYGSEVTVSAPDIENFTLNSAASKTITIREEDAPHDDEVTTPSVTQNQIIFYYSPKQYIVDYIPVPVAGGKIFPSTRETLSGNAAVVGVTLSANPLYRFDGWFTDKECQNEVTAEVYEVYDKTTGAFKPKKSVLSDTGVNSFYAKFTLLAADLTITRTNGLSKQAFVYKVEGQDPTNNDIVIYVAIEGNGSKTIKDLPLGNYTVTQQTNWSWRYTTDTTKDVAHTATGEVTFSSGIGRLFQWLTGSSVISPTGE